MRFNTINSNVPLILVTVRYGTAPLRFLLHSLKLLFWRNFQPFSQDSMIRRFDPIEKIRWFDPIETIRWFDGSKIRSHRTRFDLDSITRFGSIGIESCDHFDNSEYRSQYSVSQYRNQYSVSQYRTYWLFWKWVSQSVPVVSTGLPAFQLNESVSQYQPTGYELSPTALYNPRKSRKFHLFIFSNFQLS